MDLTRLIIHLNRIATALESAAESLQCLCSHFGAAPKTDPEPAKRPRRAKGGA